MSLDLAEFVAGRDYFDVNQESGESVANKFEDLDALDSTLTATLAIANHCLCVSRDLKKSYSGRILDNDLG